MTTPVFKSQFYFDRLSNRVSPYKPVAHTPMLR
jgi:hypothetical protein